MSNSLLLNVVYTWIEAHFSTALQPSSNVKRYTCIAVESSVKANQMEQFRLAHDVLFREVTAKLHCNII